MGLPFDDMLSDTAAARSGGTAPAFSKIKDNAAGTSTGVYANVFSDANKDVHFVMQVPHSWAHGTTLMPHIHWAPTTDIANGETVVFVLEYIWVDVGEVMDADTTEDSVTYTSSGTTSAYTHKLSEFADMSGSGHTVSSVLLCRVGRSSTSTFGGDVVLLGFDFHIQKDALGSLNELYKP